MCLLCLGWRIKNFRDARGRGGNTSPKRRVKWRADDNVAGGCTAGKDERWNNLEDRPLMADIRWFFDYGVRQIFEPVAPNKLIKRVREPVAYGDLEGAIMGIRNVCRE